jgi:hypothetical protein
VDPFWLKEGFQTSPDFEQHLFAFPFVGFVHRLTMLLQSQRSNRSKADASLLALACRAQQKAVSSKVSIHPITKSLLPAFEAIHAWLSQLIPHMAPSAESRHVLEQLVAVVEFLVHISLKTQDYAAELAIACKWLLDMCTPLPGLEVLVEPVSRVVNHVALAKGNHMTGIWQRLHAYIAPSHDIHALLQRGQRLLDQGTLPIAQKRLVLDAIAAGCLFAGMANHELWTVLKTLLEARAPFAHSSL